MLLKAVFSNLSSTLTHAYFTHAALSLSCAWVVQVESMQVIVLY